MSARKSRSSKKHFRILGYRVRRARFFGVLGFVLLLPIIFCLVVYFFLQGNQQSAADAAVVRIEQNEVEAELPTGELAALLSRLREASGLENVASMTLHGSYVEDGRKYDLALSMRAPAMIRKRVRNDEVEVVFVSSGASSQVRATLPTSEPSVRELLQEDLYLYSLLLEGAAFRLAEGGPRMHYSCELLPGETERGGQRIVSKGPAGVSIVHEIDADSGLEIERSVEAEVLGERHVLRLMLEDYRRVEGAMLPHRYYLDIDGRRRVEVEVQSVQLNPVMPLWFFAVERENESG